MDQAIDCLETTGITPTGNLKSKLPVGRFEVSDYYCQLGINF